MERANAYYLKEFGGVNAFPYCATKDVDRQLVGQCIISAVSFGGDQPGGYCLAPLAELEQKLKNTALCDIPIFHDDQALQLLLL